MKTVQQIMQETGAEANIRNFRYMQENYTYKQKIRHAENVARSYQDKCSEMSLNCHISVGGLDSITLHYFLETCGVHVPCVSCSSLEQKGVQAVHKQIAAEMENTYSAREWLGAHMALPQDEIDTITDPDTRAQEQALHDACPPVPRMYFLKPLKPKTKVIEELGWPVLSKEIAGKISLLQNPTPKNATVRHAIITGETGEYGGFQKNSRMKLSQRWLEKFGGADAEGAALGYEAAPFKVSERCCYYLKEKPCDDWAKEHNSVPYLGLMASEGGRREKSLTPHDYVPNALQSQNNITRLYSFFNTNEKIVKSSFSENEWISYYEAQVEPDLLQIAAEHTRKLWNRRQRAFGNKLYLESSNLQYASMSTKLSLESMVDRGAMLPNEWRAVFGLAPVAGGDEPIRRLDTAPVKQTKSGGETE